MGLLGNVNMAEAQNESITAMSRMINDSNSLKFRLDTDPLLERYELLLKGVRIEYVVDEKTNSIVPKTIASGLPKANPTGVQEIYNWVSSLVNKDIVQGNFMVDKRGLSEAYEAYIEYTRKDLHDYLQNNVYVFEIDESQMTGIIDQFILILTAFMSRLIGNEERKGLSTTLKTIDNSSFREKTGGFNLFPKKDR